MATQQFADNASTTLSGPVLGLPSPSTTLSVADGSKFPSLPGGTGDYFFFTLDDGAGNIEVVKCLYRVSNTFGNTTYPLVRGVSGVATGFLTGAAVELRANAEALNDLVANALSSSAAAATYATLTSLATTNSNLATTNSNLATTAALAAAALPATTAAATYATQSALATVSAVASAAQPASTAITTANIALQSVASAANGGVTSVGGQTGAVVLSNVQTFTSTGSWAKPSGFPTGAMALIEVWGGGGGGGGGTSYGGGGGGGGYAQMKIALSYLPASVTCNIGGGGAGIYLNTGVAGVGGNSSFVGYLTAYGGGGGGGGSPGGSGGGGGSNTAVGGQATMNGGGAGLGAGGAYAGGDGGGTNVSGGAGTGGGGGGGGTGSGGAGYYGGGGGAGGNAGSGGASTMGGAGGAATGGVGTQPGGGGGGRVGAAGGTGGAGMIRVTTTFF